MGIEINLMIALGGMDSLTILVLLIYEHGIAFHLFVSSSISFLNILQLSEYRHFISLVKFIPRYFILFHMIVNQVVFSNSLSYSSLLVYSNATDIYVSILSPAILLNAFISSKCFWQSLRGGVLYIISCHLQIVTVLLLPFQVECLYFFFLPNCKLPTLC